MTSNPWLEYWPFAGEVKGAEQGLPLWGAPLCHWTPENALSPSCLELVRQVTTLGGRLLMVGGWVRDSLLGSSPSDEDVEVFLITSKSLIENLRPKPVPVGADFGILKYRNLDVSFPRKPGSRHRGVGALQSQVFPESTLQEAAKRRDFTVNALAWEPATGLLHDPVGGLIDLHNSQLKFVDSHSFAEDSLRVLRTLQMVARYNFAVDASLFQLLPTLLGDLRKQSVERIYEAVCKLLIKGRHFDAAFELVRALGLFEALWPGTFELNNRQWKNLTRALGAMEQHRPSTSEKSRVLALALTCSFLPEAQRLAWLQSLTDERRVLKTVPPLCRLYDRWKSQPTLSDEHLYIAATEVPLLLMAQMALCKAQDIAPDGSQAGQAFWPMFVERIGLLNIETAPLAPLFSGRDLIPLGIKKGPGMGRVLKDLYCWQMAGRFHNRRDGIALLKKTGLVVDRLVAPSGTGDSFS